jgi:hypothetical protein
MLRKETVGRAVARPAYLRGIPVRYQPESLDTRLARLVTRERELQGGTVIGEAVMASDDWRCACRERKGVWPSVGV